MAQGCINGTIQNRTGQTLEAAPRRRVIFSGRYEGQDSFGILDLSAGLISADDAWMLSFFINNVIECQPDLKICAALRKLLFWPFSIHRLLTC